MSLREEVQALIEQMTDQQLAALLPFILQARDETEHVFSSATSEAYQNWISAENDIYDEVFADEFAAR
jgi:hypothetical protein